MRRNSQLSDILHVMLHLVDQDKPTGSEFLARMMRSNPVVVRRILSGLRASGLVSSTKGRSGGWMLACQLSEVTLLDVYRSVGAPAVFAIGARQTSPGCLVEKAVNDALSDSLEAAEGLLLDRFSAVTLQDLYEQFSSDLAALRSSQTPTGQTA